MKCATSIPEAGKSFHHPVEIKEFEMNRKALFTLFFLFSILLLTSCSPDPGNPTPAANLPNPASVYCEENGGILELRTDPSGGVAGVCIFPDNSECDEWAYFRQECKPGDSLITPEHTILPVTDTPSPEPTSSLLRIAYFKDGHVMVWDESTGSLQLAESSTELIRISDDGQVIAYLGSDAQGVFGIFAVNADGSYTRLLVGEDNLNAIQPAAQVVALDFAPASHSLYFVTDQYDLHLVNPDSGGSPTSVFGPGAGGFFSFSPDGQWMTLYHPNQLILAHPDGSGARVAFNYPSDFVYTMMGPQVICEQDSSAFRIASAADSQVSVWRIPVTTDPVQLLSYTGPYEANLSPDGSKLVYLYYQHDPIDVHLVDQNGQDTTYASYDSTKYLNLNFMGWRPDSQSFLLNLSDDGRLSSPWLCTQGGQPVKLTDTDYAYAVTWVDADRFLFISDIDLRLQGIGQPSILVDSIHSSGYDYTLINP